MTFDNFIVGKSNEVVAAAAEAVAKNPGKRVNPLFIYGGVGLGKTHLLNAIANYIRDEKPGLRAILVTSEKFTNDFVYTMKNKDAPTEAFREKYRTADVLLVDDIQFIRDKIGTQEEFFHTFNDLFQNGKQIVLASDRHPDEMPNLQERMRSRFKSGLIQDIGSPDVEMRMAILQKKARMENHHLDDEVVEHLAHVAVNQKMNVRDMEGMLFKVIFYSGLMGRNKPTLDDCTAVLKEPVEDKKIQTSADHIIEQVCRYFNLSKAELVGKKRNREIVEPRMFAIYLISEFLNIPLVSIGQIVGNRDHTTVMHARNKIQSQMVTDARTKRIVSDLSKMIKRE
jgi:chromosomal replication initiator protein